MGPNLKLTGLVDGAEVQLPQNLDALMIETAKGIIYIDLAEQVNGAVLIRATSDSGRGAVQLTVSELPSGRLALGVERTG